MPDLTGLGSVADLANTVIGRIWPDKTEQEKAQLAAAVTLVQGQLSVNQAEASSGDPYTSRWRPTIGYVLGAALAFQYVINPLMLWAAAYFGSSITPPQIGMDEHLWELITGMLGLAGWRTLDKIKTK